MIQCHITDKIFDTKGQREINVNRILLQQFACSTRLEKINRKIISLKTDIWKL